MVTQFKEQLKRTGNTFASSTHYNYTRFAVEWHSFCLAKYGDMDGKVYFYRALDYCQLVLWEKKKTGEDGKATPWGAISSILSAIRWLKVNK